MSGNTSAVPRDPFAVLVQGLHALPAAAAPAVASPGERRSARGPGGPRQPARPAPGPARPRQPERPASTALPLQLAGAIPFKLRLLPQPGVMHPALRAGVRTNPRTIAHTYVMLRLLEHGALNVQDLRAITGWPPAMVASTLQALERNCSVASAHIDGTRYFGLAGAFDYRNRQRKPTQGATPS